MRYSPVMPGGILEWAKHLPPPLAVVVVAMVPFLELRGAIPLGHFLDVGTLPSYWWAVLGNLLPVPLILWLLPSVAGWAERHWAWLHRSIERLSTYTEKRHSHRFERLRDLALITFVAIPLPMTGAWSGSLAAYVFGVKRGRALSLISIGVLIAGVIVSLFIGALGMTVS
jgi:uncharacterized membrane protein